MNVIIIETHNEDGVEWGISLTDHNPTSENYIGCKDYENANKLKSLLAKLTPVSWHKPIGFFLMRLNGSALRMWGFRRTKLRPTTKAKSENWTWFNHVSQELIIKSSSVAILVLIVIIFFKGFSLLTLGQAIIAFIMQVINYDKVLKPLGMESPKLKSYKH